jgi:hypothetical protein
VVWAFGQHYRTWEGADLAIHRPERGGRGHAQQGRATASGSVGAWVGHLGLGLLLTDPGYSGVLVSMRLLHVACAALFCLSCVVLGVVLFSEAS